MKYYRRRHKFKFGERLIFLFTSILIMTLVTFTLVNRRLKPNYLNIATMQTTKFSTLVINKAISKQLSTDLDQNSLMSVDKLESGTITGVQFNTLLLNSLMTNTVSNVHKNLKSIEEGKVDSVEFSDLGVTVPEELLKQGIIYEIPFGMMFNNVLLSSLGPKLPISFRLVGDVTSSARADVTQYGINNALIQLVIKITVRMQVIVPLASSVSTIQTDIPVAIRAINGEVPLYFQGSHSVSDGKIVIPLLPGDNNG